ncbi:MAG: transglycosylase SLT domain-containing protein [Acetobacteraceae bacterium]|nr:transglycosylase SLT domain-containing protein [Acetobacteraceae bacterium]
MRAPAPPPPPLTPSQQCEAAIAQQEKKLAIADGLLAAIGRVESGRPDPTTHKFAPWPWTINAEGQGYVFETKAEAIAAVQGLQEKGVRSIDVGCVQVNLQQHPNAFATLDEAFDPASNVAYGARYLKALYSARNDWADAAAAYHSQTAVFAEDYRRRVLAAWSGAEVSFSLSRPGRFLLTAPSPLALYNAANADAYGVWPPKGVVYGAIPPASFSYRAFRSPSQAHTAYSHFGSVNHAGK